MINLLDAINWGKFGLVIAIVAVIAIVFAILIIIVSKLCAVKEDEKAKTVSENLAGANCGGCGYAGCSDFAKALCEGKASVSDCGVTSNENKAIIAAALGVPFTKAGENFAVVKCNGGENCKDKFGYVGNEDCKAQITFYGGKKACSFGCIGGGTCKTKCIYDAMGATNGVAKSDKRLCTGCGACSRICPKGIISLIPKTAKVYIACSSKCRGKEVMDACKSGCIGCGLCAKNCPQNAIEMIDNLPVIDYTKCSGCKSCVLKCPRKCIKELD